MRTTQLPLEGCFKLDDALKAFGTNVENIGLYIRKFRPTILCAVNELLIRHKNKTYGKKWTPRFNTYLTDFIESSEEAYVFGDFDKIELTFTEPQEPNKLTGQEGTLIANIYNDNLGPLGMVRFRTTIRGGKRVVHEFDNIIYADEEFKLTA